MNSEYYCGLPQNQWDILAEQAEELLRDQEYGQHILGLYPAGPRIYGIESSSPSLLCLYVDAVDNLINPASNKVPFYRIETVGTGDSQIIFTELYSWGKWIKDSLQGFSVDTSLSILPAVQDVFYEDESISSVVSIARDLIHDCSNLVDIIKYRSLQLRALTIYKHKKGFYPCINKDLGVVIGLDELGINIPDSILEIESEIINQYLINGTTNSKRFISIEQIYVDYLYSICPGENTRAMINKWHILGNEIANLYRYQL